MKISVFEADSWEREAFQNLVEHKLLALSHHIVEAADRTRPGDFSQTGLVLAEKLVRPGERA